MKTTILTLLIFLAFLSFGQNNSTKKKKTLRIIAAKTLPDTEMVFNIEDIELQFSKKLTLKYLDNLILVYETSLDTSVYSKQELLEIAKVLKYLREYLPSTKIVKLTTPLDIVNITGKQINTDYINLHGAAGLFHDLFCTMLDSGDFNIRSNGIKLSSVTKVLVVETSSDYHIESYHYYSENSKELMTCCQVNQLWVLH